MQLMGSSVLKLNPPLSHNREVICRTPKTVEDTEHLYGVNGMLKYDRQFISKIRRM